MLHRFLSSIVDGAIPGGGLVLDGEGNLYGTTRLTGLLDCDKVHGCGIVFKLSPNQDGTWAYTILYNFTDGADGGSPTGPLIFDKAGNLYGATSGGGNFEGECAHSYGCGVVFRLSPNQDGSWTESTLHSFAGGTDGLEPWEGERLALDAAGNLYGTTSAGGVGNNGTVFKLAPNSDGTWTESILYGFSQSSPADGGFPKAGVVLDNSGNLYGTTWSGGELFYHLCNGYCGVVFKLTPNSGGTWDETVLHAFQAYGYGPIAAPTLDSQGNLYGTTGSGNGNNGLVFEITP